MFASLRRWYRNHREAMASVTDQDIIALALENQGRLTTAVLMAHTGLNPTQAGMKLSTMQSKGIFKLDYDMQNWSNVYVLRHPEMYQRLAEKGPEFKKRQLSDSEVIRSALRARGRLTPSLLCIEADVPVEVAEAHLKALQRKGVFDLEVTDDGAIVYVLTEYDTLRKLMDRDQMA